MDYNTQRKKLPLPEYGRNIQKMVDYLFTVEDRDKRNKSAQVVIDVMGNLYPYLRAHVNQFIYKKQAAFEHFLMNEYAALGPVSYTHLRRRRWWPVRTDPR